MHDLFDPETMLLSDEFLDRYEDALLNRLMEYELRVWLLHRRGLSQHQIAKRLGTYQRSVSRTLQRVQKKLRAWCLEETDQEAGYEGKTRSQP
ncbi:MAG TPA: hypothetical protein ENF73_00880 [Proteobacteria bacterium]|nr:hypothetical protein [Pseudomonadota bacterium]